MKRIGFVLLLCAPAWAAVTGTVVNRTTGQPQAGATVGLYTIGQNGPDLVEQAKSDAQGSFTINQQVQQGPQMIRAMLDAVTYNLMLPAGSPATNLTVEGYNSSRQPGAGLQRSWLLSDFYADAGHGVARMEASLRLLRSRPS